MSDLEIESEKIEAEELEKQEPKKETVSTRSINVHKFDAREKRVRGVVILPQNLHIQIADEAFRRSMSRGAIIREAIKEHYSKQNQPSETSEDGEKIKALFEVCKNFYGGFEIEDEEGFLARVKEANLTSEVWTEDLLKSVAEKLKIGFDGYFTTPDPDDLINRASEAMGLNEDQKTVLTKEFFALFESTEKTEETSEEA